MEKIPFTPQGLDVIKEELAHLKGTERQAVINAIAVAREHGDLSENAEYHAAREKQSFIEGRISELEDVTSRAEVIDAKKLNGEKVTFGTSVGVVDISIILQTYNDNQIAVLQPDAGATVLDN